MLTFQPELPLKFQYPPVKTKTRIRKVTKVRSAPGRVFLPEFLTNSTGRLLRLVQRISWSNSSRREDTCSFVCASSAMARLLPWCGVCDLSFHERRVSIGCRQSIARTPTQRISLKDFFPCSTLPLRISTPRSNVILPCSIPRACRPRFCRGSEHSLT